MTLDPTALTSLLHLDATGTHLEYTNTTTKEMALLTPRTALQCSSHHQTTIQHQLKKENQENHL